MKSLRSFAAVFLVLGATVALAACGSSSGGSSSSGGESTSASTSSSSEPFKVLAVLPTSGPVASIGSGEVVGIKAGINWINAKGGINGQKVQLKVLDDGGEGSKGVSELEGELASGNSYNVLIGGTLGADGIPLGYAMAKDPELQFTYAAESKLNEPSKFPNLFQVSTPFEGNANALLTKIKEDGIKKLAIVCGSDPSGTAGAESLEEAAKEIGVEVTTKVLVDPESVDATPQLEQAKASNPEAIAISAFSTANGPILEARKKLGWEIPVYLDSFAAAAPLQLVAPAALESSGITEEQFPFLVKGDPAQESAAYKTMWSEVKKMMPKPEVTMLVPVVGWDSMMLTLAAAEKAGSTESAAMVSAMEEIESAPQVENWLWSEKIYSSTEHQLQVGPKDFTFVPAGPTIDGLLVPGKG